MQLGRATRLDIITQAPACVCLKQLQLQNNRTAPCRSHLPLDGQPPSQQLLSSLCPLALAQPLQMLTLMRPVPRPGCMARKCKDGGRWGVGLRPLRLGEQECVK